MQTASRTHWLIRRRCGRSPWSLIRQLAIPVALVLCWRGADAQTVVQWDQAVDGVWSDSTKWTGGVVPDRSGDQRFSAVIGASPGPGDSYEVQIEDNHELVEIRLEARCARVIHTAGTVIAEVITASGDNYILRGGRISGATLSSERTSIRPGRFVVFGDLTSELSDVDVDGALFVGGTAPTTGSTAAGNLAVDGGLRFLQSGEGLRFQGGGGMVRLPGSQTIDATSSGSTFITFGQDGDQSARLSASEGGTLTLGSSLLVRTLSSGSSFLGSDGQGLISQGIIRADRDLEALTIEGNWQNLGRIEQSGGGRINLGGSFSTADLGDFQSDGGLVVTGQLNNQAQTLDLTVDVANQLGGTLRLSGGTILGGTIRSPGGEAKLISENAGGTRGTLEAVTIAGEIDITVGITRLVGGLTLEPGSTIQTGSQGLQTVIEVDGSQSISGAGDIVASAGMSSVVLSDATTLTLGESVVVRDDGGTVTLGNRGGNLVNLGSIIATATGTPITVDGDSVTNRGLIDTGAGAIVSIDAEALVNEGAGRLTGNGRLAGTVSNDGMIAPGEEGLDQSGRLIIDELQQLSSGILEFDIGGMVPAEHDQVVVNRQSTLDGVIDVNLINGFSPQLDEQFDLFLGSLVVADDLAFDFDDAELSDGLRWDTSGFAIDGVVRVTAVPEPSVIFVMFAGTLFTLRRSRRRRLAPS